MAEPGVTKSDTTKSDMTKKGLGCSKKKRWFSKTTP
jgi:hypothetical protein